MKNLFVILFISLGLVSCTNTKENEDGKATRDNRVNVPSKENTYPQRGIFLVAKNAIVVVLPDSEKVDSLRYKGKEVNVTEKGEHLTDVKAYAKANNLEVVEFKDEVVNFKGSDGKEYEIERLVKNDMIGDIILFNVNKKPLQMSAANFNSKDADEYFNQ